MSNENAIYLPRLFEHLRKVNSSLKSLEFWAIAKNLQAHKWMMNAFCPILATAIVREDWDIDRECLVVGFRIDVPGAKH